MTLLTWMSSEVLDVICDAVVPKHQQRIDFELIIDSFRTKRNRFDYAAFCTAFEQCRKRLEPKSKPCTSRQSSVANQRPSSPSKSPQRRSNYVLDLQQRTNPSDATKPTIRVDPRLETQRLLVHSIRQKLLHGVLGAPYDGFRGIEETLFLLDEGGDGLLDADTFERELLRRLKKPLTRQETDFLLANLRARGDSKSSQVDYEHLATFCNLDSDASADETDANDPYNSQSPRSPTRNGDQSQSLGGADFFATEKRLRAFFQQPWTAPTGKSSTTDTPRSLVTGAEAFLELAESMDRSKMGFLSENGAPSPSLGPVHVVHTAILSSCLADCQRIFTKLALDVPSNIARSILARFARSSDHQINYLTFLECVDSILRPWEYLTHLLACCSLSLLQAVCREPTACT